MISVKSIYVHEGSIWALQGSAAEPRSHRTGTRGWRGKDARTAPAKGRPSDHARQSSAALHFRVKRTSRQQLVCPEESPGLREPWGDVDTGPWSRVGRAQPERRTLQGVTDAALSLSLGQVTAMPGAPAADRSPATVHKLDL